MRSPTPEKLAVFLDRLKDDPTALWYFLTIHRDSILHPLIRYLKWKHTLEKKISLTSETTRGEYGGHFGGQHQSMIQAHKQNYGSGQKRRMTAALSLAAYSPLTAANCTTSCSSDDGIVNANNPRPNQDDRAHNQGQQRLLKRSRQSTEN